MLKILKFTSFFILIILTACNVPGSPSTQPSQDVAQTLNAVRTESALTVTAEIHNLPTSTSPPPAATDMVSPSEEPSSTLSPTDSPTNTPPPTATETVELATPTSTATTAPTNTATIAPTSTAAAVSPTVNNSPNVIILGVEKNKIVSVQTKNFPANQTFTIRMGPFTDYDKNKVVAGTLNSGSGGTIKFTVNIPAQLKDVERITIRFDSESGYYAYNAFVNVNSGTVAINPTLTPNATAKCEVITTTNPSGTLKPKDNFDVIWSVKNTSGNTWEKDAVDYKYSSGKEMQKYAKLFDLEKAVKSGETIKIIVDMRAPDAAGTYNTTWVIAQGGTVLCEMPLTVTVK